MMGASSQEIHKFSGKSKSAPSPAEIIFPNALPCYENFVGFCSGEGLAVPASRGLWGRGSRGQTLGQEQSPGAMKYAECENLVIVMNSKPDNATCL